MYDQRDLIARIVYEFSPAFFHDKVDGLCSMSWGQAFDEGSAHVERAYLAADRILKLVMEEAQSSGKVSPAFISNALITRGICANVDEVFGLIRQRKIFINDQPVTSRLTIVEQGQTVIVHPNEAKPLSFTL